MKRSELEKHKSNFMMLPYQWDTPISRTHIKTEDVKVIATRFLKKHPTYRAVRFVKDSNRVSSTESLFTTLVLTECEYQTEEEFLEEMQ